MTSASKSRAESPSTVVSTATGPWPFFPVTGWSSDLATVTSTSSSTSRYSGYSNSMSSKSSAARSRTLRCASTMVPTILDHTGRITSPSLGRIAAARYEGCPMTTEPRSTPETAPPPSAAGAEAPPGAGGQVAPQQAAPEPGTRPAPTAPPPPRPAKRTRTSGLWVTVGFFAVILLFLLIFILQNGQDVGISY